MAKQKFNEKKYDDARKELAKQIANMLIDDGYEGEELKMKTFDYVADEIHDFQKRVQEYLNRM